ncbi:hypothetical protein ACFXTH_011182 [Malus domestica]|uniref:uncharacterized protein n=1 Tax=Malus domestica TaxID=3750 RepID=UPI0010AA9581|nr:uncharacterized protein LOC103423886 [Malus domestica]
MYVTKPLSACRMSPQSLSLRPPEGPNSGYLVLHDEERVKVTCCGCAVGTDDVVRDLPFPQNYDIGVGYDSDEDAVAFIPVLDQPLSSNRYHVILRSGKQMGEACTNSRKEDVAETGCCGGKSIPDAMPKPLDPSDINQQVQIVRTEKGSNCFFAKSVDQEGFPPLFLRRKGWNARMRGPHHFQLSEASGINSSLRASLPQFDFPLSYDFSAAVGVGKWYCPFMFVRVGGVKLKDQMKKCMFYEIILEQRWEKIFDSAYNNAEGKYNGVAFVDAFVQKEAVFVDRKEAFWTEKNVGKDRFMWFKNYFNGAGGETRVGLSMKVVERMKWEQERVGWIGGGEKKVRVERVEAFEVTGGGEWKRFGSYVLVERFILKRMSTNGNSEVLLTYEFKHTHQIRTKWE